MNADKILWHYRCEFRQQPYWEQYENWWSSKCWRITSKGHDYVNSTFHKVVHEHEIDLSKVDFIDYIKKDHVSNPWKQYRSYRWSKRWAAQRLARNRCQHYVRQPHHEKKVLSDHEVAKRNWREKKFKRQDEKRNFRAVPYFKHINKRSHRAFERRCLDTHQVWRLSDRSWFEQDDRWSWD